MKTIKTCFGGTGLAALAVLALAPASSFAATILTPAAGAAPIFHVGSFVGTKMFLSKAKDISSGFGTVLTHDDIHITTVGRSNFADGWALITPASGRGEDAASSGGCEDSSRGGCGALTKLTFTPITGNFIGFSFQGKVIDCGQDIVLTVQDAQGDPAQTFDFRASRSNAEFNRFSIISNLRTKTIKWIEIQSTGGFVQVDHITWLSEGSEAPEPATWALMTIGLGGLGGALRRKRREAAL